MAHYPGHLILGIAALVVVLGISTFAVNRLVKRKLRLSLVLLIGYIALNIFMVADPRLSATTEARRRASTASPRMRCTSAMARHAHSGRM